MIDSSGDEPGPPSPGYPLSGVTVLEVGTFIAAPSPLRSWPTSVPG